MPDPSPTINKVTGQVSGPVVQAATVELITGSPRLVAVTGLPPAVPAFVGRHMELSQLDRLLQHRAFDSACRELPAS